MICPQCSGTLQVWVRRADGRGLTMVNCACCGSQTPGRVPSPIINYPPEVISALRTASRVRNVVLSMKSAVPGGSRPR